MRNSISKLINPQKKTDFQANIFLRHFIFFIVFFDI